MVAVEAAAAATIEAEAVAVAVAMVEEGTAPPSTAATAAPSTAATAPPSTAAKELLVSENANLKCDDANSTHEHEFQPDNLEDCAKKCMDSPWCGYYSYWPATAWCKLTSVCATKTPDSHFEYNISIYAKDARRAGLAAAAAPAAALAAPAPPKKRQ
jgi:hypothetical protein